MAVEDAADFTIARHAPEVVLSRREGPVLVRRRDAGALALPSGAIVVVDPRSVLGEPPRPLTRRVAPGRYPVRIAETPGVVAFAAIELDPRPSVRWELASPEGVDVTTLEPGMFYGCDVDAGWASFVDAAVVDRLEEHRGVERALDLADGCAVIPLGRAGDAEANVVAVASGYGDGSYPSYWGFAEDGAVVELVTDFTVLVDPVRHDGVLHLDGARPVRSDELAALGAVLAVEGREGRELVVRVRTPPSHHLDVTPRPFVAHALPNVGHDGCYRFEGEPRALAWSYTRGFTPMVRVGVAALELEPLGALYERAATRLLEGGALESTATPRELAFAIAAEDLAAGGRGKGFYERLLESELVDELFAPEDEVVASLRAAAH